MLGRQEEFKEGPDICLGIINQEYLELILDEIAKGGSVYRKEKKSKTKPWGSPMLKRN